jgi:NADH-quinone oxidoreductase subunit L
MCYLSLFTFFMLMLVTADNFLQLFVGWEGVGLCSYLLIGFWYKRPSANAAAIKAFVVNRVGDFGLTLGMFAVFVVFGTLTFDSIHEMAPEKAAEVFYFLGFEVHAITLICVLLFIGCMGKSAQLGLHTWLPDAMEGPTPVSALIHAATMVTAGVFLVARVSPLFDLAPDALVLMTIVGALTAIFAASVGLVQNDIKKVIAYSTCSQLGYMFFACGVGAYSVAIFHLMTHAFFKALLFLGAGSVIHALEDEQDMRNMGGLRKKIPVTYIYMWLGSLALAGIPVFAGFYSKDLILESAFAAHTGVGEFAYWIGVAAAFLTAFYSWRLLFMTFHGKTRADHHAFDHAHEAPWIMNAPLLLLAFGSIFAGIIGYHSLGMVDGTTKFWGDALKTLAAGEILEKAHHLPMWVAKLPVVISALGIVAAYFVYGRKAFGEKNNLPTRIASRLRGIYNFLLNKWYFDELYNALFVTKAWLSGKILWKRLDIGVIDGLGPNGISRLTGMGAGRVSAFQTGMVNHYAFIMLAGVVVLLGWFLYTNGQTFGLIGN